LDDRVGQKQVCQTGQVLGTYRLASSFCLKLTALNC
jgi:hypothetical protein